MAPTKYNPNSKPMFQGEAIPVTEEELEVLQAEEPKTRPKTLSLPQQVRAELAAKEPTGAAETTVEKEKEPESKSTDLQKKPLQNSFRESLASSGSKEVEKSKKQAVTAVVAAGKGFDKFKAYIESDWNPHAVAISIRSLCDVAPYILPPTPIWQVPATLDVPAMVYTTLTTGGYLERIWPVLNMMMGTNVLNTQWAASVASGMALFDTIALLPEILAKE